MYQEIKIGQWYKWADEDYDLVKYFKPTSNNRNGYYGCIEVFLDQMGSDNWVYQPYSGVRVDDDKIETNQGEEIYIKNLKLTNDREIMKLCFNPGMLHVDMIE
jgi:hypothetical protein